MAARVAKLKVCQYVSELGSCRRLVIQEKNRLILCRVLMYGIVTSSTEAYSKTSGVTKAAGICLQCSSRLDQFWLYTSASTPPNPPLGIFLIEHTRNIMAKSS